MSGALSLYSTSDSRFHNFAEFLRLKLENTSIMKTFVNLAIVALAASICWSRTTIASRKRTPQAGKIESSPDRSGFAFQLLQRSNPADKEPTSEMLTWVYPHATGNYKGRSGSPPLHFHLYDDEEFHIIEGRMGYVFDGKEGILIAGQNASLPAGKPHTFWNDAPDTTLKQKLRTINRSGRHSPNERFFEQWALNAYDHGGIEGINPLQLIVMLNYGGIEPAIPYPFRMLVRYVVVPIGKLIGYKGSYAEYILP